MECRVTSLFLGKKGLEPGGPGPGVPVTGPGVSGTGPGVPGTSPGVPPGTCPFLPRNMNINLEGGEQGYQKETGEGTDLEQRRAWRDLVK